MTEYSQDKHNLNSYFKGKNSMQNKSLLKILSLLLASMFILTACASSSASAAPSDTGTVTSVNLADTIQTSGNLGADQLSALTWGTSGTVDKVNVKVGQSVKAGDVLAILKSDSVPAGIITAQADLASAQRDLQNLLDSQAAQAAAQLAVANAEQALNTAQKAVASVNFPRASDVLINNTQAKIDQAKLTLAKASDSYRLVARKPEGDAAKTTAELNMTTDQLNLNTLIATYNWYTGKPTSIDADILRANLATAKASLADTQRTFQTVQNGPDPVAVAAAQAKVDAAQATVNSMAIIAPFDGQVLTVRTAVGNPVQSGDPAVELVNRNTLKVDTLVDETAISSVSVGDTAKVKMDMLPGVTLNGKVTVISSIGTTVNGLVDYTVTIALDPTDQPVRFGATANVTLSTGQPHSMLAVPVAAVQSDSAGEFVVQVNPDGSTQRITVTSGSLSGNLVTINTTAALKAGDQVLFGTGSVSSAQPAAGGGFRGGFLQGGN
jgi:RND family efflux transporter MFP subunit